MARQIDPAEGLQTSLPSLASTLPVMPGRRITTSLNAVMCRASELRA
jgi:hypothetical protein